MTRLGELWVGFGNTYPHNPIDGGSWHNDCALGAGRFTRDTVGWAHEPVAYGNAIDVARNSGPLNGDPTAAPQYARHFFDIGTYGHVVTDLDGGGSACGSAGSAHLDLEVVPYWGVVSVNSYVAQSGARYLGWADNYRGGIPADGWQDAPPAPPAPPAVVIGGSQRVVGSVPLRKRAQPDPAATDLASAPVGTVLDLVGYVHGVTPPGGSTDIWFTQGDGFYWAGGTTDPATHDLPDLTPPPVVVPPVVVPPVLPPIVIVPTVVPPVVVPPVAVDPPVVVVPPVVAPPVAVDPPVVVPPVAVDPPVAPPIPASGSRPVIVPKPRVPESPAPWGWLIAIVVAIGGTLAAVLSQLH